MWGGRVEVTNVSAQYVIPVVTIHTLYMFCYPVYWSVYTCYILIHTIIYIQDTIVG